MSANRVNHLNIVLMVVACAAALVAPFHLFLFAYAVLGPLHYLTEVSWLHDRKFFTSSRFHRGAWLMLVAVTTAVMAIGYVRADLLHRPTSPVVEIGMFLLVFVAASVASFIRHPVNAIAVVALAGFGIFLFSRYPAYGILAYLLITIVHVFVFTGFFLLAGATRSKSRSGYVSFAVFLGCAIAALFVPAPFLRAGDGVRAVYAVFEQLNVVLLRLLGVRAGNVYDDASAIGVMRFVAFAYTYHYMNWFSKTSVIRWHQVSRVRGIGIAAAWLGGVGLYLFDYRLGFAVFYVLSVVHVMLEFPLNHQTFVGLVRGFAPAK